MAIKAGVFVLNSPGTIDSDYRGEIGVILLNAGTLDYRAEAGDRIAQLVIAPVADAIPTVVHHIEDTERADGGFGSTGQ